MGFTYGHEVTHAFDITGLISFKFYLTVIHN